MRKLLSLCSVFISVYAFAQNPSAISMNTMKNSDSESTVNLTADQNPLLAKWAGAYGGVPPFDKVKIADFVPALETAMKENLEEIDKIAGNPEAPTFTNTHLSHDVGEDQRGQDEKSGDDANELIDGHVKLLYWGLAMRSCITA